MPGIQELAVRNLDALQKNPYPGRGIIQGLSTTGDFAQVYWVMGRSANSRNRILHQPSSDIVATAPFDPSKVEDPSLIIYNAMRSEGEIYVVSNGNHTDKVIDGPGDPEDVGFLVSSLNLERYEPDPPNFTPRITGLYVSGAINQLLKISRDPLRAKGEIPVHSLYDYGTTGREGFGYAIHTYNGDGDPLPTFDRDPYLLPLNGDADEIASSYWEVLNQDNRVAIAVKTIRHNYPEDVVNVIIINALGGS